MTRKRRYPKTRAAAAACFRFISGTGWPARFAHAIGFQRKVDVTRNTVQLRAWPEPAGPLRIGFAADFHAGPTTYPALIEQAFDALATLEPHVLLLGGDYVSLRPANATMIVQQLADFHAPLGTYAVLGNHDHWTGAQEITRFLVDAGVRVLVNESVQLPAPYAHVWICGLDDHSLGDPDASRTFANAHGVRVLLLHSPSGLLDIEQHEFDVAFAGHTHGGQIALPGGIPVILPGGELSRKYAHGKYSVGQDGRATLIVTRGVGCSTLPFRLFAPSEVIGCTLTG